MNEWKEHEDGLFLMGKSNKEISELTGRSIPSVVSRRTKLRRRWGEVPPDPTATNGREYHPKVADLMKEPSLEEWLEHLKSLPKWKGYHRARRKLIEEHESKLIAA